MAERGKSHSSPKTLASEPECLCDAIAMLWPEAVVNDKSWPQTQAEPKFSYDEDEDEDEIRSYLWPFEYHTEPWQEICFELYPTPEMMNPEMMNPCIPSSSSSFGEFMYKLDGEGTETILNHQVLQPPSQVLQTNGLNPSEEEERMSSRAGNQLLQPPLQVLQINEANQSEEEQSRKPESAGDTSGMSSGAGTQLLQPPSQVLQVNGKHKLEEEQSRKLEDGSSGAAKQKKGNLGGAKKPMKKRRVDDDSWMPEGWVKKVNQRLLKGKFPGYVDKKYYAPGVARAFRSKVQALRYIDEQRSATATGNVNDANEEGHKHEEFLVKNREVGQSSASESTLLG